jgi:phospholipid/cholesterol/gamma-HCH transport system substrate-binding protein
MTERSRNIVVGLTAIVGLGTVLFLIILFGYIPRFLEGGYTITIHLPAAGGLSAGSRAYLSGIDIGGVDQVALRPWPQQGVAVTAHIRGDVPLPRDASVTVTSGFFGAAATLNFSVEHLTDPQRQDYLAADGSALVQGQIASPTSGLLGGLRDALEGPTASLAAAAEDFRTLSTQWTLVGKNLNELLQPRTVAAVDAGDAQANLSSLLARTDQGIQRLSQTIQRIHELIGDPALRQNVHLTAQNAAALTGKLVAAADSLSQTLESAHKAIDQARQGDGTVGKLVKDPALYDNLNDAAQRLSTALTELNALLTKLREEGLPVKF